MVDSDGTAERLEYDEAEQRAVFESIEGGQGLLDALGFVPFFHDAELVQIELYRGATSVLVLRYNPQPARYVDVAIFTVTFNLRDIAKLALSGAGPAWVQAFKLGRVASSDESGAGGILVTVESDTGLAGTILSRDLMVSFEVGYPPNL